MGGDLYLCIQKDGFGEINVLIKRTGIFQAIETETREQSEMDPVLKAHWCGVIMTIDGRNLKAWGASSEESRSIHQPFIYLIWRCNL